MKCPSCDGKIKIDNSCGYMTPTCTSCGKAWNNHYLDGYWDGYNRHARDIRALVKGECNCHLLGGIDDAWPCPIHD